jgi:hypothetical protein
MYSKTKPSKKVLTSKFDEIFIPTSPAGLARTHRIIRIEREKEIQFMKLCCQIRLDDSKKVRSDNQREQRKLKRVQKYSIQTTD